MYCRPWVSLLGLPRSNDGHAGHSIPGRFLRFSGVVLGSRLRNGYNQQRRRHTQVMTGCTLIAVAADCAGRYLWVHSLLGIGRDNT